MTKTRADATTCGHCHGTSASLRDEQPWCPTCGIWLVHCPLSGEWVSYAEREHRHRAHLNAEHVTWTRQHTLDAVPAVRAATPPQWSVAARQFTTGFPYTVRISTPHDTTSADLSPTPDGWHVHVSSNGSSWPLYEAGGVRAAHYPDEVSAARAALNDLAIHDVRARSTTKY